MCIRDRNEDHKKFLEEKAASGNKNCCVRYVNGSDVTVEDVKEANVIIGNVDPALVKEAKNLELFQLNSAGAVSYTHLGSWKQSADGRWWWDYGDGTWPAAKWLYINGKWYYFQEDGYMATGWITLYNKSYYLDPVSGEMYKSRRTPDGMYVNESGAVSYTHLDVYKRQVYDLWDGL